MPMHPDCQGQHLQPWVFYNDCCFMYFITVDWPGGYFKIFCKCFCSDPHFTGPLSACGLSQHAVFSAA